MQLLNDTVSQKRYEKCVWLLLAITLNGLELFIPRIPLFPWLKPGLSNAVTIIWIMEFGAKDALIFTFLRVWVSSFYFGFSFVTFLLAFSGGILSTIGMGILYALFKRSNLIGVVGIGVIGAVLHNLGQLVAVYFTMAHNPVLLYQLPFMIFVSLIFGSLVGSISIPIYNTFTSVVAFKETFIEKSFFANKNIRIYDPYVVVLIFAICISMLFVKDKLIIFSVIIILSVLVQIILGLSSKNFFYPLKSWMLFLGIGIVYLFFSYGTRIEFLPFITKEGLESTLVQWGRLWVWLESALLLKHFHFHQLSFGVLKRLLPKNQDTLFAGLVALEYFPKLLERHEKKSKQFFNLLKGGNVFIQSLAHFLKRIEFLIQGAIKG